MGVLRYTPAGAPVVEGKLSHRSQCLEAGIARNVECDFAFLLIGPQAALFAALPLGTQLVCAGFVARRSRHSSAPVLHITRFDVKDN
ncbi:MAG: primosomal replication protein N [Rhodocyclaceae bacterium]|nr:primosomal replication protein N [Rhodocyclaceae bacterium]MBX3670504.1 primosomal replication protein N [Rhodocyclaceae bacterium]